MSSKQQSAFSLSKSWERGEELGLCLCAIENQFKLNLLSLLAPLLTIHVLYQNEKSFFKLVPKNTTSSLSHTHTRYASSIRPKCLVSFFFIFSSSVVRQLSWIIYYYSIIFNKSSRNRFPDIYRLLSLSLTLFLASTPQSQSNSLIQSFIIRAQK